MPNPDEFYTDSQRAMQADNQSSNLAKAVVAAIVTDELQEEQTAFIESRDFFFLSTVNSEGEPTVSYKGGPVGVVKVMNDRRLLFPNFDGNGMFYSMGNVAETSKIGLLFIDMESSPVRVRVQGTASITHDAEMLAMFPGANMVIDVAIDAVFYNCARYIHKHQRLESSKYVPNKEGDQPYPAWKRIDKIQPALHPKDMGRAVEEGGTITDEEYGELVGKGES